MVGVPRSSFRDWSQAQGGWHLLDVLVCSWDDDDDGGDDRLMMMMMMVVVMMMMMMVVVVVMIGG